MKSKLEIYALSVCFAAVICLVISAGIGGYSIFEVLAPELTMKTYKYEKYTSNDGYWKTERSCSKDEKANARPSEEELTKRRLAAYNAVVKEEQRGGFQSLIKCFIFIFFSGIALLVHWKIAKRARE
jgi:hypothetical protein